MEGTTVVGRNHAEGLPSRFFFRHLGMQMTGYPGKIIHQTFRVFENLVVDPLQSVAVQRIPVFTIEQKGIVGVPVAVCLGRSDLAIQLELHANLLN